MEGHVAHELGREGGPHTHVAVPVPVPVLYVPWSLPVWSKLLLKREGMSETTVL